MGGKRAVRLLHLSDIHFRESTDWDADPLLRALTAFVGEEVARDRPPDLVAITGDLAFSGIEPEYVLARTWLEKLWAHFGDLPRDRLLLVPGNHDVDRTKVGRGAKLSQKDLLESKSQDTVAAVLGDEAERRVLLDRHGAYLEFANDWLGETRAVPWWERTMPVGDTTVHAAGLDSAWMACGADDRGNLLLGRRQLNATLHSPAAERADWRIALLHHPWDYLAEFEHEEAPSTVRRQCDVVLRGHRHKTRPEYLAEPGPGRQCLELAAGCVYETSQYPNAFQWIELSAPPEKRVRVRFCLWHEGEWIVDKNRGDDGWWQVDLGAPASPSPKAPARPGRPAVPAEYAAYIRRAFGTIDLLGAKEGRAVTLGHVYVPALTPRPADTSAQRPADPALPREAARKRSITLLERLDGESLYVPAAAGAGKSTFCRWAALQSVADADVSHPVPPPEEFAEPVPASLLGRLPLLVPLREFWRGMPCGRGERIWRRGNIEKALASWIGASPPEGLSGDLLLAHLAAGTAFVLLDGLDEVAVTDERDKVTCFPRELLLSGLADALPVWLKAGNRVLLTSRPYGLDEAGLHRLGLPAAALEPLPAKLQDLFASRWFHTLGKPEKTEELVATIRGRDDLRPLTENPMLLTAVCVLYDNGGRLPEDRHQLYKDIVANVLHNRYPGEASQRAPVERRLEAVALGMHEGDAERPRTTPAAEVGWGEVEHWLARFAKLSPATESDLTAISERREDLLNRSGLLVPRPGERAAFYHLSFQEFLAARRLARLFRADADLEEVFRRRRSSPEWRATLLFLFAAQITWDPEWGLGLLPGLIADQDRTTVKANPAPAAFVAEALDLCVAKGFKVPAELTEAFRALALDAVEDEVELQARQAIGLCLGRIGDRRIHSLRDPASYVEVPAGVYPYGEKGGRVEIRATFRIGRYPVTNSQYAEFIGDGGYREEGGHWWSEAGLRWRDENEVVEPERWRDRRWNGPNQPVVGVSFWEAEACARWAGGRLPSEQEWEAAARGPSGLEYPWGNDWEDDGICNSRAASLGMTSPVGLFPRSRQAALGIEDLAGNVWEWCDSFYDRSIKDFSESRVVRGASWNNSLDHMRAAYRNGCPPVFQYDLLGFRVVCSSPISSGD